MYEPVHIPWGRPSRRRIRVTVGLVLAALAAIAVTVALTMPRRPTAERLTLDELALMMPDAAQTEALAALVRARIANLAATPRPSAAAGPVACAAPRPPHTWDRTQRENATTIGATKLGRSSLKRMRHVGTPITRAAGSSSITGFPISLST